MYFSIPLEQGLRLLADRFSPALPSVFQYSIRTRIKTQTRSNMLGQICLYFSIPLEQGLRQRVFLLRNKQCQYFSIPLEQGLRPSDAHATLHLREVFQYSIRTRIKTAHYCSKYEHKAQYFSIPLEQGLRHQHPYQNRSYRYEYIRIPLEQGLRRQTTEILSLFNIEYFSIPLEQGLRR